MQGNIYLIGYMGTGKTSVGKALAEKLGWEYLDTDDIIVELAGKDIPSIFKEDGEITFRELEIDAVKRASQMKNHVVSLGGGAILNYINVLRMKQTGVVVLLTASPEEIVERLEGDTSRPLIDIKDKEAKIRRVREMLHFREPFYLSAAEVIVKTDGRSIDEVAEEIIRRVEEYDSA